MGQSRIVSDTWYGDSAGARNVKRRSKTATLAAMMIRSFRSDTILTSEGSRGGVGLIILAGFLTVTGQRKLVLTEFLPGMQREGFRGRVTRTGYRLFLGRALLRAQTMTSWERDSYAKQYHITPSRLVHIQFYTFDDRLSVNPTPLSERDGVFASGRNSTDWPTLLRANAGQEWSMTVVARAAEREVIESLRPKSVQTEYDIPRHEHDTKMNRAQLMVLPLRESSRSAGHVRLMTAATNGVPVIATDVQGIRGYEHLAVKLVNPSDPDALREGIAELLADPEQTEATARAIRDAAKKRPFSLYAEEMRAFALGNGDNY